MSETQSRKPLPSNDGPGPTMELPPGMPMPDNSDLISRIHFALRDGRIWLDDQRMMLMHTSGFGVLRRELIESLGSERARGLLTRIGYNSGAHDARLAHRLRGTGSMDAVHVGPQLHMIEGAGTVLPIRVEIDQESGRYYGEYVWLDAAEAEEHIRSYGISAEPVCWMQIGYASGFVSRFMGRPVLFREVECRAQGHASCRIVGKPADEWVGTAAEDDLRYLRADQMFGRLSDNPAPTTRLPEAEVIASPLGSGDVVGVSAGFNAVCHRLRRVADTRATVLFLGESGVGKEVLARSLHRISPRAEGPFIAINCAAIPESLVEAELFGVERGAYTGAAATRAGRFERADGGTLFLDEIGILSNTAQGKLLRALQEREVERVGGCKTIKVDVRVIAATNLSLQDEVRAGRFREDLFYRLNVFPIQVPALRERLEDIPVFMNHFLQKFCRLHGRTVSGFTGRAIDAMLGYRWPGNIRELENMVERGVILAPDGGAIDVVHLFTGGEKLEATYLGVQRGGTLAPSEEVEIRSSLDDQPQLARVRRKFTNLLAGISDDQDATSLDEIQNALIESAIRSSNGNLSAAARLLGMTRAQLVYHQKGKRSD